MESHPQQPAGRLGVWKRPQRGRRIDGESAVSRSSRERWRDLRGLQKDTGQRWRSEIEREKLRESIRPVEPMMK
ncbi:unnamed protein product [Victoria cruziana]